MAINHKKWSQITITVLDDRPLYEFCEIVKSEKKKSTFLPPPHPVDDKGNHLRLSACVIGDGQEIYDLAQ